jgi:hypothetical protein
MGSCRSCKLPAAGGGDQRFEHAVFEEDQFVGSRPCYGRAADDLTSEEGTLEAIMTTELEQQISLAAEMMRSRSKPFTNISQRVLQKNGEPDAADSKSASRVERTGFLRHELRTLTW